MTRKGSILIALALLLVLAPTALAGTGVGGVFNLGVTNTVDAITVLTGSVANRMLHVNNNSTASTAYSIYASSKSPSQGTIISQNTGGGAALDLRVGAGKTPMKVSAGAAKVANLDADKLDGKDSSAFLQVAGKAADADTLDGIDSTGFYAAGSKVADSTHADNADHATSADSAGSANTAGFASNADALDGKDSSQFIQGQGQALHGARALAPNGANWFTVLQTPNPGVTIGYNCPSTLTNNGVLVIRNDSGETVNVFSDNGSVGPDYKQLGPNGGRWDQWAAAAGEHITIQVQGTVITTIEVFSVHRTNPPFPDNVCHIQAQALITR